MHIVQKHSKDRLAEELRKAGLEDMAKKAEQGYYHDFLSPLPMPCMVLDQDLKAVGTRAALALRARHHQGEFDATREESDDWIHSQDGKEALERLPEPLRHALAGETH